MVPDLGGKELTEALLELQVKELYPRIQLRYSHLAMDKGYILEQDPIAGSIVKAGRRVRLIVSQGVRLSRVENYIGRTVDDVRLELQAISAATSRPLVTLKEPFMYEFSNTVAPGVVLRQSPGEGMDISGPVQISLVVSRGPEQKTEQTSDFVGLSAAQALEKANREGVRIVFAVRPAAAGETPETVVFQNPPPGASANAQTIVYADIAAPSRLAQDEIYGLFSFNIPSGPAPLPLRLEAHLPTGETRLLAASNHRGGDFTYPWRLREGSVLVLFALDREVETITVTR
jgi:beta-lactam-binding protein with PASTA domain